MSHNKKRNTAFLFDIIITEISKAAFAKKTELQKKLISLLKESFKNGTTLNKEFKLYREILETNNLDEEIAERVLFEVKKQRAVINNDFLFKEQTKLQGKLKKLIGEDVFSNFVPNFKNLATVSQIFNSNTPAKARVLLEKAIVNKMCNKIEEQVMVPADNLVLKKFIERFNVKYTQNLLSEQKILLNKYIMSFSDNALDLKTYLNKEVKRLKEQLTENLNIEEFQKDDSMLRSAKEVISLLESYKNSEITFTVVEEVLKIQSLLYEIKQ